MVLRRALGLLAWALGLLHGALVLPFVAWWESGLEHAEESTKAFIREAFGLLGGALNDAGAWVLSAVDASYADTQRRAWQRQQAWQHWWREDRTSTLNAVVANAQLRGGARRARAGGWTGWAAGGVRAALASPPCPRWRRARRLGPCPRRPSAPHPSAVQRRAPAAAAAAVRGPVIGMPG
jgi:hypothetical protein